MQKAKDRRLIEEGKRQLFHEVLAAWRLFADQHGDGRDFVAVLSIQAEVELAVTAIVCRHAKNCSAVCACWDHQRVQHVAAVLAVRRAHGIWQQARDSDKYVQVRRMRAR